jgi:carbon monoxide dehydrogenase subunit G
MQNASPRKRTTADDDMDMSGSRTVPADIETTWRALNDPEVLKACIAGCESVERVSDNEYRLTMTARVGPVSARFTGRIVLADIVAPTSYTLSFEGQGGAAGFAKGEARVTLADNNPGTRIDYQAKAQVGGKLAQIGSRLVDGAAAKVADDFFARFADRLGGPSPATVDAGATNISANPVTRESQIRAALRTMSVRLALAAAIIAVMAIYWFTRQA